MHYVKFKTVGTTLSKSDKMPIVSGSVNFYGIEVEFDEFWNDLAGTKTVQFYKNRNRIEHDLVDGRCILPNSFIEDRNPFEIRVCSGDSFATPWIQVVLSEGGPLFTDAPDEGLPEELSYVKTLKGEYAIALLRNGSTGLEYSINGVDWESAINGIPDVPRNTEDISYVRKRGDWVPLEKGNAISNILSSPTRDDFNNLLSQLRKAGVISE